MTYFLISFQAMVNGIPSDQSFMGIESPNDKFNPDLVVEVLTKKQKSVYPWARDITIVILEKRIVTNEEYSTEIKNIKGVSAAQREAMKGRTLTSSTENRK